MGIVSEDSRIINIQVRQQLTNVEIQKLRLASHIDDNTTLKNDLFVAYSEYMNQRRYIITHIIKLYRYIRYTLLNNDGEFYLHIKIHIGDIVTIKEENDKSYAIVKAIFTHKYNDGHVYAFVWIDWLKNTKRADSLLRYPIFEKQTIQIQN
ncbi:5819_t:CDS:1, partial [Racocetra fulgida]